MERPGLLRLRSSILGKVLGALVLVLVVSTSVTALVDARLTHSVVATQTRRVATSNLQVLQEAFSERQRSLVVTMGAMASRLGGEGLADPARRTQLIARLGTEAQANQLDLLDVLESDGSALQPPVGVGRMTASLPLGGPGQPFTTEPTSRLLPTPGGKFVQAVPAVLGSGERPLVLLGGLEFGDDLAYRLRRQVGNLPNVILVAGSKVAGSTLPTPLDTAPALETDASGRPQLPRVARLNDVDNVLAYVSVGRSASDPVGGALGIALPDPAVALDRALAARRLVAATVLAVLAVAMGWFLFRALTKPLVTLARTAVRIAGGQLEEPFVASGSDEIARLAGALEHMRQELRAKLALVAHQAAELRVSSQRIVAAQDEERRRLARDLHDGIQQQLVVLRLRLGLARKAAAADGPEAGLLTDLGDELDHTIASLREVSHDLFPAILRDRGLAAALRSYAARIPLTSTLSVEPEPLPRMSPDVESAAYFLMSEAVTNALKHARASELSLAIAAEDGHLTVRVTDDGRGFDAASGTGRGGLLHMEDRVRSFGGTLRIETSPGSGTSVIATFPLVLPGDLEIDGDGAGDGEQNGAAGTAPAPASDGQQPVAPRPVS